MHALLKLILAAMLVALGANGARAADTQVAVAANFTAPAKEIAAAFHAATGHTATLSFGVVGQPSTPRSPTARRSRCSCRPTPTARRRRKPRVSRCRAAASPMPSDAWSFIRPSRASSIRPARCSRSGSFAHLAIADPATAPYGAAAVATMTKLGVAQALAPKLVTGSSITQAYQFVATGAAELGFVARSEVIDVRGGSRWLVPATLHPPIVQQAVLLKTGAANPAATAFVAFLRGPQASAIIRRYGYEVDAH